MAKLPNENERVAILLEDMRSQFKAVIEHVTSLDKTIGNKLDNLSQEINETKHDLSLAIKSVQKNLAEIKSEFPLVKTTLSDHEHRIKKLEAIS